MASSCRPVVLTMLGAYWPAADANGPVRSLLNLAKALSHEFEFRIVGRDRPYGTDEGLPPTETGRWHAHESAFVRYEPPSRLGLRYLTRFLRETPHDILYLNSLFEKEFAILPLIARRLLSRRPATIVAPRGELGEGAVRIRHARKAAYLAAAGVARLHADVAFHATSSLEQAEIRAVFPANPVFLCPNIAPMRRPARSPAPNDGALRVVYLSRVARKKNLDFALRALERVRVPVTFDIYGPISEPAYWDECQRLMRTVATDVKVTYRGEIPSDDVPETLSRYDLFFLPTTSENFGHAIVEALAAAVPVLISNRTPWRGLEGAQAGFDLPLDDVDLHARTIERYASFGPAQRMAFADGAAAYINAALDPAESICAHRAMFNAQLRRVSTDAS